MDPDLRGLAQSIGPSNEDKEKRISAFRRAEKYFKTCRKADTPGVLDVSDFATNDDLVNAEFLVYGSRSVNVKKSFFQDADRGIVKILSFPKIPGLFYFPGVLSLIEQKKWAKRCLQSYTSWENKTNFTNEFVFCEGDSAVLCSCKPDCPHNFWDWVHHVECKVLDDTHVSKSSKLLGNRTARKKQDSKSSLSVSCSRKEWLRRLRWTTLGLHYNWTDKIYCKDDFTPFPDELREFVLKVSSWIHDPIRAEAAIVNYYHVGDSLMGHTDHSEENHQAPLLSISIGNAAIFLLGGKTRDEEPLPILLQSGDIIIMKDSVRLAYHGVPAIIPNSVPAPFKGLIEVDQSTEDSADWGNFATFFQDGGRINMNVRQVY